MLGRASATIGGAVWPHLKCFLPYIERRGAQMKNWEGYKVAFQAYYDEDSGELTRVKVGTDFAAATSLLRANVLKGCIEHFIKQYNATITEQHLKETEVLWVPWKWVPTTIDITTDSSTGTGPGPKLPGGRP
jgi:hypothetical protein